jgi:mevalonate kinase
MFAEDERTDELSVAVKHIDTFAENINDILAQANTALEESKKAIEKLANMAQDEPEIEGIEKEKLKKALDTSEDIAIQSLEDLSNTANMLKKLQQNFNNLHK